MTLRRIALAVLVLVAILAGLAGFYLREPPASADSIERIPAYQNEALLARAWVLPVARLYGPQGYLFQQNQSVCGPTSIADVMRSEGFAADTAAMLSRSDSLQIFGFLPFGLTLDEEARLLERDNGEYTSFPKPNVCNALPTKEEVFALSEIASAANGRTIVDLPSGVGFCLFITRECLDSVGYLSEAYSRGYLEDVDYCLSASAIGFRNVCATGVYVGHAGNRSFESEKRGLVVRNLAILNERFPDYERECSAFVEADPLKSARANLEERLGPEGTVVLLLASVAAGRALALERARQIEGKGDDLHCIYCEVHDRNDRMTLKSVRGSAPQSLTFALNEGADLARLHAYLVHAQPEAVEVIAPYALPDPALRVARALEIPIRFALGDLDWLCDRDFVFAKSCPKGDRPGECHACVGSARPTARPSENGHADDRLRTRRLMVKAESIAPMDRMAAAFCAASLNSTTLPVSAPPHARTADTVKVRPGRMTLGVLCPEAAAEPDRQILAIERLLDEQMIEASVIVLGLCLNEIGLMSKRRIFVTGVIAEDEYERVLRQYRTTHLFSPYRTRHFGLVDRLSAAIGLPKGYFDWSFGALDREPGDLALDPRICFESAARQIGAWTTDRPIDVGDSASPLIIINEHRRVDADQLSA